MNLAGRLALFAAAVVTPIAAVWASFQTSGLIAAAIVIVGAGCSAFCILALVSEARSDGYDHGRRQASAGRYADRGDGWGDDR